MSTPSTSRRHDHGHAHGGDGEECQQGPQAMLENFAAELAAQIPDDFADAVLLVPTRTCRNGW